MRTLPTLFGIMMLLACGVLAITLVEGIGVTNHIVFHKVLTPVPPPQPSVLKTLPPGVYQSFPYSMIVVVPGPTLDRMLISPPDSVKGQILSSKAEPPLTFRRIGDQFPGQKVANFLKLPSVYSTLLHTSPPAPFQVYRFK